MENQQSNMFKQAMTYGIYLAGISIFLTVVIWAANLLEYMGILGSSALGFVQLTLLVILLLLFTKKYRDTELEGKITFGQAFVFGVLMVVLSTVITSLFSYIFNKFIDPEYTQRVMTMMQDKMYQWLSGRGMSDEQIESALKSLETQGNATPIETLVASVEFGLIGGAVMSLISSLIVKKNAVGEDAFDEAMDEIKNEE